jgi:Endonuclease/Exonuclease/phosphatase family
MRAGPIRRTLAALLVGATAAAGVASPGEAQAAPLSSSGGRPLEVRIATFNASLNRTATGELIDDLSSPDNAQAATVAEIIQRVRPDLLLINEFDFDPDGTAAELFQQNYLSVPHNGAAPIEYPYHFVAPSNTGIPSGFDLNNDGSIGGPDDALGFGFFPGQFGMAVYSMHPIVLDDVRTFQTFLWADMPAALLPDDPATAEPGDWFSAAELGAVRLSSKSHWDLPIDIDGRIVHFLVSHPTPPVFDGPEDRNGRRNHDEIRFWADYVRPGRASAYIYDDAGQRGGLAPGARCRPTAARPSPGEHVADAVERRGGRGRGAPGRCQPHPSRRPRVRYCGLRRLHSGEPAGRLRVAVAAAADSRRRGLLAHSRRPTVPPGR